MVGWGETKGSHGDMRRKSEITTCRGQDRVLHCIFLCAHCLRMNLSLSLSKD